MLANVYVLQLQQLGWTTGEAESTLPSTYYTYLAILMRKFLASGKEVRNMIDPFDNDK